MTKVLLIGGGGREAALAWALQRADPSRLLRCAPGNAGIARHAERVPIAADDVVRLIEHARREKYDLVVVGPEAPLVAGLADRLRELGLPVFGPSAAAAQLEGSKVFAKEFMARHGIATAGFRVFDDADACAALLRSRDTRYPIVIKADGLAAGKGVVIAGDAETAAAAAAAMLRDGVFGAAGRRVVVEDALVGREASFFALCDGERFVELAPCQDYKRALDGDRGLNTGGMGTYSPSAHLTDADRDFLRAGVVAPVLRGMAEEGRPFHGVLFVGVMLTADGPRVLEFNARFGDPETQVLVPRLDGDWYPLLHAAAVGDLRGVAPSWSADAAVCVVMAAAGYPGSYSKGATITGIDDAERVDRVVVFHAGTEIDDARRLVTSGGRVLGVTALGADAAQARERAYEAVSRIHWDGAQHRTDIALDAVPVR